jgi:peroxiredoxin family protein
MTGKIGIVVYSDDPKSLAMAMNLGHTALAMDAEVLVYFTFDGLTHLMAGERDLGEFERMVEAGVPNPYDMLAEFVESGGEMVTTVGCTTTLDMLDWDREHLDDAVVTRYAGAATFLRETEDANHVFSFG